MIEISIVIPVYCAESKLRRCLDSITVQTFQNFEVILIDDGSPDDSGNICEEYSKSDYRFFVIHQENKGASVARNRGIQAANGIYLAFVDSDDYLAPDYLEKMRQAMLQYSTDFCMCNYINVLENGEQFPSSHGFSIETVLDQENIRLIIFDHIFRCYSTDGLFSPWAKLFKREIVLKNHLKMDPHMSFGEDMLFVVSYFEHCCSAVFIGDALYYYEKQSSGLFSRYRPALLNDALRCFQVLKQKTAPCSVSDEQFLPLTLKYYYYVNRYLEMGIKIEKKKKAFVRSVLENPNVIEIYNRIARFSDIIQRERGWNPYEFRIALLIHHKKRWIAIHYLLYQLDRKNIFRRFREFFRNKKN